MRNVQLNCKLRHNLANIQSIPPMMKTKPAVADACSDRMPDISDTRSMRTLAEMRLREASVRITPARVKVLTTLLGARCAFSHQDIQDTLVDMDRVTLYRALDCLTDAKLAHKIAGDDRVFRYSVGTEHGKQGDAALSSQNPTQHQHGHFKCTRCAKVFCLDGSNESGLSTGVMAESAKRQSTLRQQLQSALQETLGKGFQSHDIELTIKGWCADCAH
jgi:Fur family ferric uptake transcriptional regulator